LNKKIFCIWCDSSGITLILEEKSIPVLAYFYFENR